MKINLKKLKKLNPRQMAAALALGIALLMLSSFFSADKGKTADRQETGTDVGALQYAQTEKRLKAAVEKVRGISDVTVFITYENSGVKKTASDSNTSTTVSEGSTSAASEDNTVMKKQSSSEEPFVSEEVLPQVRGVLIVAKGAGDAEVNAKITDAVSAVLGVPIHKVKILSAD